MKPKTVVVLPGSDWQIPIIEKSKFMGYHTLVINPAKDSPAFPFADGHLQSDIFDIDEVARFCRAERVDAVVSDECDIAMPVVAELGNRLSLRTIDVESAHLFTNKYAMRCFCTRYNIPTPEYRLCTCIAEAEEFFEEIQAKAIIKPLDSNSSRGIHTIYKKEDIRKHFEESCSFSRAQKAVLIERYIDGIEFTVDGVKTPEKHFSLAVSQKKHFDHNTNIARELFFTHEHRSFDYVCLKEQNDYFVNMSPLEFALTHAEYKYKDGEFYLIEIAARGGGNLISSHIVPYMSGFDTYQYLLDCSLGSNTSPNFEISRQYKHRCSVLHFFKTPRAGGLVERIDGMDFLENTGQVVEYRFNCKVGDRVTDATTDANRIGFYIACCENERELLDVMGKIREKVRIICTG